MHNQEILKPKEEKEKAELEKVEELHQDLHDCGIPRRDD